MKNIDRNLRQKLRLQVMDQFSGQLRSFIGGPVINQLRNPIKDWLEDQLWVQLENECTVNTT